MTLTTHAVVGGAISAAFRLNPAASLLAGFMSHFLLDHIPHWDYISDKYLDETNPLNDDIPINRESVGEWVKIIFDIFLGPSLVLFFFTLNGQGSGLASLLAGAFGGMLPDGLQFLAMKFKKIKLLVSFRQLHLLMCSPIKIKGTLWGPFFQAVIILLALVLGNWRFFIG